MGSIIIEKSSIIKEHMSFRIDKEHLRQLKLEAKRNHVSVNTLVNQIIYQYVDWHSFASKAGEISMQKSIISLFLEKIDTADLIEIAQHTAKENFKHILLMLKGEYTLSAWIEALESWIRVAGFAYKYDVVNNQNSFMIQHNMGKKFSIFQRELIGTVFGTFKIKPVFEITNNSISFKFNIT